MTVKELIEALKQCPQNYEVFYHGVVGKGSSTQIPVDVVGIDHNDETVDFFTA